MRCLLAVVGCLFVVFVSATAPSLDARQQPQQPAFKTQTLLVRTDVTVLDSDHRFVRGLSSDDFRVFEDDVPQRVSLFSFVDIPLAPLPVTPPRAVPSTVVTNADAGKGSLVAIILDDVNTLRERAERVKEAARRIVMRLQPEDYVWVAVVSGKAAGTRDFTRDRGAVLQAIDTFEPTKTRLDSNLSQWSIPVGTETKDVQGLRGLSQVAERLAPIEERRKAIIFIGEGVEMRLEGARGEPMSGLMQGLAESAARSNIRVYTLDPRGPTRLQQDGVIVDDMCGHVDFTPWADRAQVARDSLDYMAQQTGGTSVLDATDFSAAADRLVADMGTYYAIGYYPTNAKADGKFRRLRIETKNSRLQIRAYSGYWAPKPKKPELVRATSGPADPAAEALDRAILGLIPTSGLVLRASIAFTPAARGKSSLTIPLRVESPAQRGQAAGTGPDDPVRVRILIVDMKGKVYRPEDRIGHMGDVKLVVDVPPGRYVVRLAAFSSTLNAVGSLFMDVQAPDFRHK